MHIAQIDPPTAPAADLAGWHEVLCATVEHDVPGEPAPILADLAAQLQHPSKKARWVHWLARVDGQVAGTCELKLEHPPNHDWGSVHVAVAPAFRRRGIARALLAEAIQRLNAEGRQTVTTEVAADTAGVPFAETHGFSCALTQQHGVLRTADADAADLDTLVGTLATGYELRRWIAQVPQPWVDSYVRAKQAMGDAPNGDLTWQPPAFDAAQWRGIEDMFVQRGQQMHFVAATHHASGAVAGLTEVLFSRRNPRRTTQADTLVVPEHRGRGLGLAMKADMLRWLRAECPAVAEVETWNAESNTYMLAINDRLGSRRGRRWHDYQGEVTRVIDRLPG